MSIHEQMAADEIARKRRLAAEDAPVSVVIPGFGEDGKPRRVIMTYAEGQMLAFELEKALTSAGRSATNQDGTGQEPRT